MASFKIPVISVICALLFAGCGLQQKSAVPRLEGELYSREGRESRENTQGESSGAGVNDYPVEADSRKEIIQPGEIRLPSEREIEAAQIQGPLPSMSHVNDRIYEYGRKLAHWREIDARSAALEMSREDTETMVNCFVDLQKVLNGYNLLRADMLRLDTSSSGMVISSADVLDLQKKDISFLESVCGKLLSPEGDERVDWENRDADADLPQLETMIERYTDSREYEEVIQVWQRIPEQQKERVHLRTKISYGNALMFLHQEEKAAEIYQQIVDEMSVSDEQKTDLLSLRRVLADLYTASGDYTAAENQYLNISRDYRDIGSIEEWSILQLDILERSEQEGPELAKYSSLLRNYLGFVPERDGFKIVWDAENFLAEYPYSPVASNVDIIKDTARQRAQRWFEQFFIEVDALAAEKKYLDAIEKLEAIPGDIISPEQKDKIKARTDELVLSEAVERETRKIEKMQELQTRWNEGMVKVEDGKYDEAISIFQTLLQTEYHAKAEDKIQDITLLAAKSDRRTAADLYIRYTKTSDIEMKKKLLTESRRLLTEILKKYSDVDILDKVQGNIDRVEQEMNALDPTLLPAIKAAENGSSPEFTQEVEEDDFASAFPVDLDVGNTNAVQEKDLRQ